MAFQFFDSRALVKKYLLETGTDWVRNVFNASPSDENLRFPRHRSRGNLGNRETEKKRKFERSRRGIGYSAVSQRLSNPSPNPGCKFDHHRRSLSDCRNTCFARVRRPPACIRCSYPAKTFTDWHKHQPVLRYIYFRRQ